ncbi:MAG: DUF1307 domain-containing protein [Bacilli bacterium]|nr:DUF1307 domain-containing protein [Bacilli bacterium]
MTTRDIVKKYIPLGIGIIILIILFIYFVFPPFGKMVCEVNSAPGDMNASYTYVADFSLWRVYNFKMVETVRSADNENLLTYRESIEKEMSKYKNLDYYDNLIVVENRTLTNIVTIDYKNIDMDQLQKLDKSFSKKYINIYRLKRIYRKNGAVCKYV